MRKYVYCGVVMSYGKILAENWYCTTYASSKERAISNIKYRFRKQYGYVDNMPLGIDIDKVKEM